MEQTASDSNGPQPRSFEADFNNSKKLNWKPAIFRIFGITQLQDYEENKIIQLELGMDKAVVTNKGRRYSIELKSRRPEYFGFLQWLLEIVHLRYTDKTKKQHIENLPGWLYTTTADIVIYGTYDNNNEIIEYAAFTPTPFKNEEFKKKITQLEPGWADTRFANGVYQLTLNKKVSLSFLKENADKFWGYWKKDLTWDKL